MPHPEVFTHYVRITADIEIEPDIIIKKGAVGRFDGEIAMFWPKDVKKMVGSAAKEIPKGYYAWYDVDMFVPHESKYILVKAD